MKRKSYDFCALVLMLFIMFAPLLMSLFDAKTVIYISLALTLGAVGYSMWTRRVIPLSQAVLTALAGGAYALICLIWVSNKGEETFLAAIFLETAALGVAASCSMKIIGKERLGNTIKKSLFYSGIIFAVVTVFYQFFLADSILGYKMNFASPNSFSAAAIMVIGGISGLRVNRGKRRRIGFIIPIVLMSYVFLMTRSLWGFMMLAVIALCYTVKHKKHRVKAFVTAVLLVGLSITELVAVIMNFSAVSAQLKVLLGGIISIVGMGSGGYNAENAILGMAYEVPQVTGVLLSEAWGILGIAFVVFCVILAAKRCSEKPNTENAAALVILVGMIFASSEMLAFALPILCAYYAYTGENNNIRGRVVIALPCYALSFFALYLFGARCVYPLANTALSNGDNAIAAQRFEAAATAEIFSSEGWEKAYNALDNSDTSEKIICLENAMAFNRKNLEYKKQMTKTYSEAHNFDKSLEIWNEIINEKDEECLYPEFAQALYNAMSVSTNDTPKEKELYGALLQLTQKCQGDEVKRSVNDTLSRAQRFYVASVEGDDVVGDMYVETSSDVPTEPESESETEE